MTIFHTTEQRSYWEIHEFNSGLIIALVIVHILMIIIYRVWARVNLLFPMISGYMQWPESTDVPAFKLQHWAIGLLTAIVVLAVVSFTFGWIDL